MEGDFMITLTRSARGVMIAAVLALVWAAPAAAAETTRTVRPLSGGFVLPAGTACAFDVAGEPRTAPTSRAAFQSGGFVAETDFSDGSVQRSLRARGAYVNLETGARFPTLDTYRDVSRFDPATGIQVGVESGQMTWSFLPGDVGPYGVVGRHGALYHFIGGVSYTFDTTTNHATQFAYSGTVTDVCAALS
jgi:hypothetical protein